jgi:hypothetical protein
MKKKLLLTIIVVFIGFVVKAQNRWSQKINFSATARIIGKVSATAEKVSKTAPGLVGKTAKLISTTTKAMSASAQRASEAKNSKQ